MSTTTIQLKSKPRADDAIVVPPGYTRTEIGVIPKDWDVDRIDKNASIKTGAKNTQDRMDDGEYPFFVRSQEVERINSYSYDGEAVLTAGDGVGTGKVFHYIVGRFDVHQRVYRISNFSERLDGRYFFYQFSTRFYDRIMSMTAKSSVDSVRMEMIAGMQIPLPSPSEQHAIAGALSDVDGLIGALDKLIAKKRAIKQAAMQQLLTGKTRLPGFSGEWNETNLHSLCDSITDGTHYTPRYVDAGVPFYSVENVTQGDFSNTKFISPEEHTALVRRCKPERGDILLTRIGSLGDTKLIDWNVNASIYVSLALLKLKEDVCSEYVYAYTKSRQFVTDVESRSLLNASPKKINMKDIGAVPVIVPPTRAEQQVIGKILLDIDADIEALERRCDKTMQIKQGMMQQLLTGRIRLVKPQASAAQFDAASKGSNSHSWAFNEAVVISTLAKHFGSEQFPLGRKRYTKLSYLLHRRAEGQVQGYLKKAAGPYNPRTKYGGPERIAVESGYVREHKSGPYRGFVAADSIDQAEGYFEKWYGPGSIQWLEQFRFKKNDELEVLATVDMAAEELRAAGKDVDVAGVKDVIRSHPEWKAKLDRPIFSDANIARAIETSRELFDSDDGDAS